MKSTDIPSEQHMHFFSRPQIEQLPSGSWCAHYPASEWSVTAESREAVIEMLKLEDQRRLKEEPGYLIEQYKSLERHLTEPIPGVYAISQEEAERIRASENPEAEFDRIANKMDAEGGNA